MVDCVVSENFSPSTIQFNSPDISLNCVISPLLIMILHTSGSGSLFSASSRYMVRSFLETAFLWGSISFANSFQLIVLFLTSLAAPNEMVNEMILRSTVAIPENSGPQICRLAPT
ncbi:hypothetical protein D3C85_1286280 [compost metagenome]